LLGKKLGDGFKDGKITLLLNNPRLNQEVATLPALQQFVLKEGNRAVAREDEKPKVPRKTEAVASPMPDRPARVAKAKDQPPAEPSPGSEPPAKPVQTTQTVWYWYQNNLPVYDPLWVDTPFLNGLTPLFLGSSRLPPLGRHPQAPPVTPVPPSGSTGTTIQDQTNRVHPAFRRPPFVPDPLNRGGASSGNQPRIPGGVSVPANTTPTDPTLSSPGTVTPPSQTQSGTTGQTQSGTSGTNATMLNRGGSTMLPSANIQGMTGNQGATQGAAPGGTVRNNTGTGSGVQAVPPNFSVPGPGDGWKRYRGFPPVTMPPGSGGVTPPNGGVQPVPPNFSVPGPGNDWRRFPGMMPPWWRIAPMNQPPTRPMAPAGPRK
jgi:hypothetical protein